MGETLRQEIEKGAALKQGGLLHFKKKSLGKGFFAYYRGVWSASLACEKTFEKKTIAKGLVRSKTRNKRLLNLMIAGP